MATKRDLTELRAEAQEIGVFLPLEEQTDALMQPASLHGRTVENRSALLMQPCYDADENGAPTAETVRRYCDAVTAHAYGMLWTEPVAMTPDARADVHQLMLTKENQDAFSAMMRAISEAAERVHGFAPLQIALFGHAGCFALKPAVAEQNQLTTEGAALLSDDDLTRLVVSCADRKSVV